MHKSIRSAQKKEKRNTHTQNGGSNTSMYLHGYHANNNGIIFDIPIIIFTNSRKTQEKNNTHKYKNEKIGLNSCVCYQRRYILSNFSRSFSAIVYIFYINVQNVEKMESMSRLTLSSVGLKRIEYREIIK